MSGKKTETLHAQIIDIKPWWYIQFSERFQSTDAELIGVHSVFNDPNEPTGDSYARSPVVLYPEKFEVLGKLNNEKYERFYFLHNPHVNIGDKVVITKSAIEYKYSDNSCTCFFDEINKNITQQQMINKFIKKYINQNDTGLILNVSYFKSVYMPGYGSDHDFKDLPKSPYTRIHRVSVNHESDIFVASPNGKMYSARGCLCYSAFTPGDVVQIDNGVIFKLISNIKTR